MMMVGAYDEARKPTRRARVAEATGEYADVTADTLGKAVSELEAKMFKHAELLEFEEAAQLRDRIRYLREKAVLA